MADIPLHDGCLRELALFAGAGGGILGGHLLGWRTVCAVERDSYAASVLVARQNDGFLAPFPIWSDVASFDGRPWRGLVDVVSGGFPCQDISAAGKGAGIDGERSGLWREMARIVGEVRPRYVFVENSPLLVGRGLVRVLADLAEMGFDATWGVVGAADVGAPHQRDRLWIVANANGLRELQPSRCERDKRDGACHCGEALAYADGEPWNQGWSDNATQEQRRRDADRGGECAYLRYADRTGLAQREGQPANHGSELAAIERADWWAAEPDVGRVVDELAARVDRIRVLGNGQVPQCAATAWRILTGAL